MPTVTLSGPYGVLEPLGIGHIPGLLTAGQDERIWTFTLDKPVTAAGMNAYVTRALTEWRDGATLPFAVRTPDGEIVGSTRLAAIARSDRGVEIGWTWYAPRVWRTALNTQCKLLLLRHAFESLGCIRVELKTDARNSRSRAAIARLGAVEEGTLRSKVIMRDGYRRDSVYYSILEAEWPGVRSRLEGYLERAQG